MGDFERSSHDKQIIKNERKEGVVKKYAPMILEEDQPRI